MTAEPSLTLIVMGVSGSGKTTVGRRLADRLGCPFVDGDDYHPAENVARMTAGIPLEDAHRWPWLEALRDVIRRLREKHGTVVAACSALKSSYRDVLRRGDDSVTFVLLRVDPETVSRRFEQRTDHFMPPELIESQFETLEEPSDAMIVDAGKSVEGVVTEILGMLGRLKG